MPFSHGAFIYIIILQIVGHSLGWIPMYSQLTLQGYPGKQYQLIKPQFYLKPSDFRPNFNKFKTQTFYKASLVLYQAPVYEFRYKIHDPKEKNYQEKSETRIGDSVRGYYSVREPNGYIRLVKYVSDENGFHTQVSHHHVPDNGEGYLLTMTRRNIERNS